MKKGSRHTSSTKRKISLALRGRKKFGPTTKFRKVYGNYCGKGNRGGRPVDAVDAACRQHDICYHKGRYKKSCDEKFVNNLAKLNKLGSKQKAAKKVMSAYFKTKGRISR